jgi:hypothetical protein
LAPDCRQLSKHFAFAPAQPESAMMQSRAKFGNIARTGKIPPQEVLTASQ